MKTGAAIRGGGGGAIGVEQEANAIALPTAKADQNFRILIPPSQKYLIDQVHEAVPVHKRPALTRPARSTFHWLPWPIIGKFRAF